MTKPKNYYYCILVGCQLFDKQTKLCRADEAEEPKKDGTTDPIAPIT
jgi:hypothetical protein